MQKGMANKTGTMKAFQITLDDALHLFGAGSSLAQNAMAAFPPQVGRPTTAAPSTALLELQKDPQLQKVQEVLTQPQLRVRFQKGGGNAAGEYFAVYARPHSGPELVALHGIIEGVYAIIIFENFNDYVDWWVRINASSVTDTVRNLIPGEWSFASLAYLLHAVDCVRRLNMESMLRYAPLQQPEITEADFMLTLALALRSDDMRWLLPAFVKLTPGMSGLNIQFPPGMGGIAEQLGILVDEVAPDQNARVYRFRENGVALGVEFNMTWLAAFGWGAEVLTGQGPLSLQSFMAATAMCNHVIEVQQDDQGVIRCQHNAFTTAELQQYLLRWWNLIWEQASATAAPV